MSCTARIAARSCRVEADSPQSAEDAGFEKGWRAEYEAAFNQVMGHVDAPAGRGDDEPLPPC